MTEQERSFSVTTRPRHVLQKNYVSLSVLLRFRQEDAGHNLVETNLSR